MANDNDGNVTFQSYDLRVEGEIENSEKSIKRMGVSELIHKEEIDIQTQFTNVRSPKDSIYQLLQSFPVNQLKEVCIPDIILALQGSSPKPKKFLRILSSLQEDSIPKSVLLTLWMHVTGQNSCVTSTSSISSKNKRSLSEKCIGNNQYVSEDMLTPKPIRKIKKNPYYSARSGSQTAQNEKTISSVANIAQARHLESKRKSAEDDLQLLKNRISLLQQVDLRTWKEIERTKDRTKELLARHENKIHSKELTKAQETQSQAQQYHFASHVRQVKEISNTKKQARALALHSKKQKDAATIKKESRLLQQTKINDRLQQIANNYTKRCSIRQHEKKVQNQKTKKKILQKSEVVVRETKRLIQEQRQIQDRECNLREMQQAEEKLREKLKETQIFQKQIYHTLENTIGEIKKSRSSHN